ncbi:hypothetical protein FRC01_001204 [Tulasnella sp. 417]|nr:hypothetical protein FRC01_001204 [Tulasnella sp. 417]
MADKSFVLDSGGIALSPPPASQVTKFLCKQYLMMAVKANRDQLVEFCHLVVLLDLEHGHPPQDLVALVHDVMKNPEAEKLKEAIEELKDYADGLPKDPRKTSSALADAWKQSQKIREGRVAATLDKNLVPDHSSSNEISKSQIPIQVQVWSQTKGKLDNPASEIRCAVPRLSMVGNLDNIVRYAATRGFNFPYSSKGELRKRSENVKISSKAMLYSMSSNIDWVLRDKSAKLADVVDDAHRLQMVNTKLKTLAVAVAVLNPHKLSERFIFGRRASQ